MKHPRQFKTFAAALAAASLFTSSAASAAPATVRAVDPLVAVSLLGTSSSQAAVCTAGAASVAAGAAAAAQATPAQPGCVIPVVDAPPPGAVSQAPPPVLTPAPVASRGGIGVLPVLLGLAAIAGGLALLLDDDDDDGFDLPISPA